MRCSYTHFKTKEIAAFPKTPAGPELRPSQPNHGAAAPPQHSQSSPGISRVHAEQLKSCKMTKSFSLWGNIIARHQNPARQGKSSAPQRYHVPRLTVVTSPASKGPGQFWCGLDRCCPSHPQRITLTSVSTTRYPCFPVDQTLHSFQ